MRVDDCAGADDTAKILAASAYSEVDFSNRTYVFNGEFSVKGGQVIRLNGANLTHTDNTKRFFTAIGVDEWSLLGPGILQGTLVTMGSQPEKGVYIEACRRARVRDITAQLFLNAAFHIVPGTRGGSPFLADTVQLSGLVGKESILGIQIDAGTAAEYVTVTGSNFVGNISGAQIAAGNAQLVGVNLVKNESYGLMLTGGSNNGHGSFIGNINHNGGTTGFNIVIDDVTNGFDFCAHVYADTASTQKIWFKNGSTSVQFAGSRIDAGVIHDASGTNRITGSKLYSKYALSGSNMGGFSSVGNF